MNIAVLCSRPVSRKQTSAFIRSLYFINDKIHPLTIIDCPKKAALNKNKTFDLIVWAYGFGHITWQARSFIESVSASSQLVWFSNEYDLQPDSVCAQQFKKRSVVVLANHPPDSSLTAASIRKRCSNWICLNFNLTAFTKAKTIRDAQKYNIVYYGRPRPNRQQYFSKYFIDDRIFVSCNKVNAKKYKSLACKARFIPPLKWKPLASLGLFKASLYLEDEATHTRYSHMADRWYEALSNNVLCFFDRNCANTVTKSGYSVSKHAFVDSLDDALMIINNNALYREALSVQQSNCDKIEKEQLVFTENLKQFFDTYKNAYTH